MPLDPAGFSSWQRSREAAVDFAARLDWMRRQVTAARARGFVPQLVPRQMEFPFSMRLDSEHVSQLAA